MSFKKTIFILAFCAVLGGVFGLGVQTAKAATVEELQALIVQLTAQIAQLQQQLNEQQGQPAAFCYDFTTNLRFGDGGGQSIEKESDVRNLQIGLEKDGFAINDQEKKGGSIFGESTASAVVGFQQKYKQDVLTPYGLQFGTGYVGKTTRAKLNALYGCSVLQPPVTSPTPTPIPMPTPTPIPPTVTPQPVPGLIAVLSPNGGEELFQGVSYFITWQSGISFDRVSIILDKSDSSLASDMIIQNISNTGSYTWTIGDVEKGSYKIRICEYRDPISVYRAVTCDSSDSYFNIARASMVLAPEMVYPVNGQTLNYGYPHGYMFKVKPITGASGYLFGFFQNGVMVYENWRDNRTLSKNGEFAIWPSNPFYSKIQAGDLQVWVRAWINNQWSEARVITIKLVSATTTPSISIISSPQADSSGNVTVKRGEQIVITGVPKNLLGQLGTGLNKISISLPEKVGDYSRAFFFDPIFDGACGNTDWVMTCTANQTGTSKFYIRVYQDGKTYQSNIIQVTVVASSTTPSITVLSPNGGEKIEKTTKYKISWTSNGGLLDESVNVDLYKDGQYSMTLANNLLLSSGQLIWLVSDPVTTGDTYKIRIGLNSTVRDMSDYSDNYFSIVSATTATPSITVTSPNGGEALQNGSEYTIKWNALSLPSDAKIYITLFRNDERNTSIVSNLPYTQREYTWKVTQLGDWGLGYEYKPSLFARLLGIQEVKAAGVSYKIMISASWGTSGTASYGNVYDQSDNYFGITSTPIIPTGTVSLDSTTPASTTITAGQSGVTFARVKISAAGNDITNMNWIQVGSNSANVANLVKNIKVYDGATQVGTTAMSLAYNGSYYYYWIPVSNFSIPAYSSKVLRIVADVKPDVIGPIRMGITGLNFISPGASIFGLPVYGYEMTIAKTSSTTPSITITSPNGGEKWAKGSTYDITWSSSGIENVTIELYGSSFRRTIATVDASLGKYSLTIADDIPVADKYRLYLTDYSKYPWMPQDTSDNYFSIVSATTATPSITSFNYTETDAYNGSVKFYWTNSGTDSVNFWVPCYSGLTIKNAATGASFLCGESDLNLLSNNSLYLKFTNNSGASINVIATLTPIAGNITYATYSKTLNFILIPTTPSITVLSPNGGEALTVGQNYNIQWAADGLEKVRIYIETPDSTGSGSTNYITGEIQNMGTYNWVVVENQLPVSTTNRYKIRIDGIDTTGQPTASLISDKSDNYFSIVE